jgi:hypothetical protein
VLDDILVLHDCETKPGSGARDWSAICWTGPNHERGGSGLNAMDGDADKYFIRATVFFVNKSNCGLAAWEDRRVRRCVAGWNGRNQSNEIDVWYIMYQKLRATLDQMSP